MQHLLFIPIITVCILSTISPASARRRAKERPRARSWLVASLDGRTVYDQKNADKVRAIASLSKIMATLVVVESGLKLSGKTKLIPHDWLVAKGGCRTRLKRNKYYTNLDLLHAAILGSDNRAIPALGRAVGYNVDTLVRAMNRRARKMGLKHTHFVEPTGISHENVSTAKEVLMMLRAAAKNKVLSAVMSKEYYSVHEKSSKRKIIYNNTNILTRKKSRKIIAGKTGFNNKAGYCLATAMERKNVGKVAFIILGSTGMLRRFSDYHVLNRKFNQKLAKMPKALAKKRMAKKNRSKIRHKRSKRVAKRTSKNKSKSLKRHAKKKISRRRRVNRLRARKPIRSRKHRNKHRASR